MAISTLTAQSLLVAFVEYLGMEPEEYRVWSKSFDTDGGLKDTLEINDNNLITVDLRGDKPLVSFEYTYSEESDSKEFNGTVDGLIQAYSREYRHHGYRILFY